MSCLAAAVSCGAAAAGAPAEGLQSARKLLLGGHYAEAEEAYRALPADEPAAALGLARALAAAGKRDEAQAALAQAVQKAPASAELQAELAALAFQRGDHPQAAEHVQAALAQDANCLQARWLQAELARVAGKLDEANTACQWLVDYYNDQDVTEAEPLHWIGLGAAQFARWNRLSDQFSFLVNELYPSALEAEEGYWPALYEQGRLFLEKYNQAEASKSLKEALVLNPAAAEVYAALARLALQNYDLDEAGQAVERALAINPNLLAAHHCRADLLAANFQLAESLEALKQALLLNPADEETLGRLAATYILLDGLPDNLQGTRAGAIIDEVNARNPHAGEFYYTVAEQLSERRKFPAAERFYQEALRRMPQLVGPQAGLGMMYMRMGQEAEAQKLFEQAMEVDPFHVRVNNMLQVLDVLSGYAVLETEHFILKFDRGQDELLARYAARYLEEEVYPALTRQFGFEPEGKSLFEIFNRAKNTSGHGWFSARMVGLPYIGTVGACAGKMVALASPNGMDQKFNWARVLKHEFVHVLNLQQTNFNIPHWYTEALAVLNEGYPRPQMWNEVLAARFAEDKLFDLGTINLGFIRPQTSLDWHLAYCQAELYAEYMLARFGERALADLLAAYAGNLGTAEAIKHCFQVELADFEAGYREHVRSVVAGLRRGESTAPRSLGELEQAWRADPQSADAAAELAEALLARQAYQRAGELARQALALSPAHPRATYVRARLKLLTGETEEALALLEGVLDPNSPDAQVLGLLAAQRLKAGELAAAEKWYELGRSKFPAEDKWLRGLARTVLLAKNDEKLAGLLAELAEKDADDLTVRKKLAQLALARRDFPATENWARQGLWIDVLDADVHQMLAEALAEQDKLAAAIDEFHAAVRLKPKDVKLKLALAQACLRAEKPAEARQALEDLLKLAPGHAEAKKLLEGLP